MGTLAVVVVVAVVELGLPVNECSSVMLCILMLLLLSVLLLSEALIRTGVVVVGVATVA